MKKLVVLICFVLNVGITFAQGNFEKGMTKGMEMLKASKTAEDFVAAANHFERVASVENNNWVPVYWNAYTYLIAGMNVKKESQQDEMYDKAMSLLESIENSKMERSEYLTLKGYIMLMKISVSPMSRAPQGTPAAMGLLTEAQQVNPKNPRPLYVMGQNTFYTPSFFGGGKDKAKPMLANAVELYKVESASDSFMPRWGKGRAESLLKECE